MTDKTTLPNAVDAIRTEYEAKIAPLWNAGHTDFIERMTAERDAALAKVAAAFRTAATVAGDAAVKVLLRQDPDASLLRKQMTRQAVANPVRALIPAGAEDALQSMIEAAVIRALEAATGVCRNAAFNSEISYNEGTIVLSCESAIHAIATDPAQVARIAKGPTP